MKITNLTPHYLDKTEQLERLCSEDTLLPHDYSYYWPLHIGSQDHTTDQFLLDPKSKPDKVKVTNIKNLLKLQFFYNFTMKWIWQVL